MVLDSTANVTNKPYSIELALTVGPAALTASPAGANVVYYPCQLGAHLPERPITFDIGGTAGLNFRAAVVEVPPYEVAQASLAGTSRQWHRQRCRRYCPILTAEATLRRSRWPVPMNG